MPLVAVVVGAGNLTAPSRCSLTGSALRGRGTGKTAGQRKSGAKVQKLCGRSQRVNPKRQSITSVTECALRRCCEKQNSKPAFMR